MAEGKAGFYGNMHTWQSGSKKGKLVSETPAAQPPKCPQCDSTRLYKDGLRPLPDGSSVQRWLCRECGLRFSCRRPLRENSYCHINTPSNYVPNRQVCDLAEESKNLIAEIGQLHSAGESQTDRATIKGKIVQFSVWLKMQGYPDETVEVRTGNLARLVRLGVNISDPETVKETLSRQTWKDSYKMLLCYAYESFMKMENLKWIRPRYRQGESFPFIPTEQEIDQLIAATSKKISTFLQGLKDTGADPGELVKLRWIDINKETRTLNITPIKGHNPRVSKVSEQFMNMLERLPKASEVVFRNYDNLKNAFYWQRKRIAEKLGNPRLRKISFTTFRHWKGTMEYHRTKDLLYVKKILGHKTIQNTLKYIDLEAAIFETVDDQWTARVAGDVKEATTLIEAGFDYVTGEYSDGGKIFRKRK